MRSLPVGTQVILEDSWGYSETQILTDRLFEFAKVPPGRYVLRVRADGFNPSEQIIDVEASGGLVVGLRLGEPVVRDRTPARGAATVSAAALRVPKAARRELNKGRDDLLKGKPDSALRHFQAASSIYPDWAESHAAEALVHMQMSRTMEAETALRQAAALNPEWYVPWKHLGYLFLGTGRFEEALEYLDHARRLFPTDALIDSCRGEALFQLGRHAEAAEAFKAALELDQADLQAGYRLGYALLEMGQAEEALVAFETFLRKHRKADSEEIRQIVEGLRAAKKSTPSGLPESR
jgi:tetratricopeptide (TPR) repeat protein